MAAAFARRGRDRLEVPGPGSLVAAVTMVALAWVGVACSDSETDTQTSAPAAAPTSAPAAVSTTSVETVRPEGFERVGATITAADGTVCEVCLWLAETGDQRSRGLMGVTDIGAGDGTAAGMAFVYPSPHTGTFWMKNTLLPLSIAFFAESGEYLGAFDMEPCTADPCPTYPTAPAFTVAIEVPQGDLPELAIAEGSSLALTTLPCNPG